MDKEHDRLTQKENNIKKERFLHLKEANERFLALIEEKEKIKL